MMASNVLSEGLRYLLSHHFSSFDNVNHVTAQLMHHYQLLRH
jgi:hypothetical protein